jgi:hypothetical protein
MQPHKLQEVELMLQGFFSKENVDLISKIKDGLDAETRQELENNFAQIDQVKKAAVTFGELREKGLFTSNDQARAEAHQRELYNQINKLSVNLSSILTTVFMGAPDKEIVKNIEDLQKQMQVKGIDLDKVLTELKQLTAAKLDKTITGLNKESFALKNAAKEEQGLITKAKANQDIQPEQVKPSTRKMGK